MICWILSWPRESKTSGILSINGDNTVKIEIAMEVERRKGREDC